MSRSIIVVSPNPTFLEVVQSLLADTTFHVAPYTCYVQAQMATAQERPVLVAVAHQQGYLSPWLFLRVLQFDPLTRSIPALICDEVGLTSDPHQVARQAHYHVCTLRPDCVGYEARLRHAFHALLPARGASGDWGLNRPHRMALPLAE